MAKILWIEDEADRIRGVVRSIEKEHDFDIAYSRSEALRKLEINNYDLIILDIYIPPVSEGEEKTHQKHEDYEGIKVLEILRNELKIKTKLIIFSVVNTSELDKLTNGLNVFAIMQKGTLSPKSLKEKVNEALGLINE